MLFFRLIFGKFSYVNLILKVIEVVVVDIDNFFFKFYVGEMRGILKKNFDY